MSSIAIISPDGNWVVGFSFAGPLEELQRRFRQPGKPGLERDDNVPTAGDWPLRFDRIHAPGKSRWQSYRPKNLPRRHW